MSTSHDVLVIGAGPVGLALALELKRHGLSPRIVDQNKTPSLWSKAQIIHARTMELLAPMGVIDDMLAKGKYVHGFNAYARDGKRIVHFELGAVESPYPFMLSLSQRETELILARHLEARGVNVEREVRLDRFRQDDTGVESVLIHADGREETVRTAWVAGCDGARSTVRKLLDIPFEGKTYEQKLIQADVRVDMDIKVEDDEIVGFISEHGLLACFPLPGERRFRVLIPNPAEADLEPTLETFQRYMRELGPTGAELSDPLWMVGFTIHCRMVPAYRKGRGFLAGDAAHIHSPAGGQGMNTGIQDACNLAWKLALVHRGKGLPILLDSYEVERLPVAAAVLAGTDAATERGLRALSLRNPIAVALRNSLLGFVSNLGFVQTRAARAISMTEIAYTNSPITGQDRPSVLFTDLVADRDTEEPGVRDWMQFGGGPAPGERAPDAMFDSDSDDGATVFGQLHHGGHTLLLFDGAAATESGYQNLASIAAQVTAAHGDHVRPHVIVLSASRPAALDADAPALLDCHGAVHKRYGARSECLYLIRPDGYVAYRCQPADGDQLAGYLSSIFAA